jgi:hypothetical protein
VPIGLELVEVKNLLFNLSQIVTDFLRVHIVFSRVVVYGSCLVLEQRRMGPYPVQNALEPLTEVFPEWTEYNLKRCNLGALV